MAAIPPPQTMPASRILDTPHSDTLAAPMPNSPSSTVVSSSSSSVRSRRLSAAVDERPPAPSRFGNETLNAEGAALERRRSCGTLKRVCWS